MLDKYPFLAKYIHKFSPINIVFENDYDNQHEPVETLEEANALTSQAPDGYEAHCILMLDIDLEAALIPSTNNNHLYVALPRAIHSEDLMEFLKAAEKIGLLEEGFVNMSIKRGYTSLRLPWIRKESIPREDRRLDNETSF